MRRWMRNQGCCQARSFIAIRHCQPRYSEEALQRLAGAMFFVAKLPAAWRRDREASPHRRRPVAMQEVANCASYLDREWQLLREKRVILALGGIAWNAALALAARNGCATPRPRPAFGHGAEHPLCPGLTLLGSYHVSQQNTFTGRLTPAMFDAVLRRCLTVATCDVG